MSRRAVPRSETKGGLMAFLTEALKKYIGLQSETETACDPVERGAVRRYAQAIQDEDPIFWDAGPNNARFGGPVAPPLFPTHMFRRAFGAPDPPPLRALGGGAAGPLVRTTRVSAGRWRLPCSLRTCSAARSARRTRCSSARAI